MLSWSSDGEENVVAPEGNGGLLAPRVNNLTEDEVREHNTHGV